MKITVAHSPDSDDAFMHYGLASGKVPTDGIEFGHLLADIETLNRAAIATFCCLTVRAWVMTTDRLSWLGPTGLPR
jgi:1,4-dihydroxy-6-naphthoate synthase